MKKLLFLLATSLAFVACSDGSSDNKNTTTPPSQTPENEDVTFVATVGEYSRMNGKEWEANDALSVVETSGEESAMKKYSYTATSESSEGLFTSTSPFTLTEGESATFTIYYPYNEEGDEITESTSKQSAEGHKTYDYLYCSGVTATYEAPEAIAVLEHKMSELTLDFQYAEGLSKEDVEYITIKNILVEGSFDPETGVAEATGTPEDLVIYMDEFTGNIILYPQTIDNGIELELTMVDGSVISATLALTVGELVTGYSYTWDVEVEASDIESEDDPQGDDEWNDDDEDEGDEGDDGGEKSDLFATTYDKVSNYGREYTSLTGFEPNLDGNEQNDTYDLEDFESPIDDQITFSSTIYTKSDVLSLLSGDLYDAVDAADAGYACVDSEDGVFLFNKDDDDILSAVEWYKSDCSKYFDHVSIDHSTIRKDGDTYTYVSMTIDGYWEAGDELAGKIFIRNFYNGEQEEGWTETITSDLTITKSISNSTPYESTGTIESQICSLIGIEEMTHTQLHNAGWWTTVFDSDGETPVEQGYYNCITTSGKYLGWFLGTDGYLDRSALKTTGSFYWRVYGYQDDNDVDIRTFRGLYIMTKNDNYVPKGSTGNIYLIYTNGVDKIVLVVPYNIE